jgi:hypothetical protein
VYLVSHYTTPVGAAFLALKRAGIGWYGESTSMVPPKAKAKSPRHLRKIRIRAPIRSFLQIIGAFLCDHFTLCSAAIAARAVSTGDVTGR